MGFHVICFDHRFDERRCVGAKQRAGTTRRERVVSKSYFALDRQAWPNFGVKASSHCGSQSIFSLQRRLGMTRGPAGLIFTYTLGCVPPRTFKRNKVWPSILRMKRQKLENGGHTFKHNTV